MKDRIVKLCNLFEIGVSSDEDRELLGDSLFYYCCGKDPSPIIAFGSKYPLYVYSDLLARSFGNDSFENETELLYQRIREAGNVLLNKQDLKKTGPLSNVENAVLTSWRPRGLFHQNDIFHLLYVQHEAAETFRKIYFDLDKGNLDNYIQPKCVCNYRFEFDSQHRDNILSSVEKRIEYILGYCYSDKYRCVGEFDYYGDYGKGDKIQLFQRMYWFLY